jgi:quinol monooxygenase YgiN
MILIHGFADIRPDARDRVAAAAIEMQKRSRAEAGCVHYGLSWDGTEPNRICLLEIWVDDAAYRGHKASEHGREFTQVANESVAAPPTFVHYQAEADPAG